MPIKGFDKRSIRTIYVTGDKGRGLVLIGCPKGKYKPKIKRCSVPMKFIEKRKVRR